ncbi:TetR/AcrR family transcriptional regulator [Vibrio alginolyticus]|uniref:TetR/AcrR family transcriptional regulator n=1 Tax=Vibrio TaxID=662 RepID=UPI000CE9AC13|nr:MULTISPECIES: TetR/AcrR family transcriptional regulator [Vibrio]MDW2296590.1 TetR/AcrR family transcriptional regulator [Vibrio sp. 1404]AVF72941.1 TetR/AcrR family transcriptional regulator [Vibrio alginolyticus]EKY4876760.1 TetR/AcrR family transcriptional regulator [Vibrio alginolyticus]MBS9931134.1 TetR/AcrR family transcriptional regulator [Vibrio alginolyticus]MBS9953062.1 TetR/AcrR family transcriptional regulator [Vibrio alginolyticus]
MNVKRKSRSETKREAILCAARQAFQEFGVQNTSMDKLSAIAQVSKRTVYNHFPSKEAIVTELLTELWRSSMMDSDIERLPTLPLKDQLIELLYSEIIVVTEPNYIELAKVAFGHFLFKPEDLKEQAEQMSKQETALYRWLTEKSNSNALQIDDVHIASTQLHNLLKGSAFWPQLMGIRPSLSNEESRLLATQTAELFLSHYQNS